MTETLRAYHERYAGRANDGKTPGGKRSRGHQVETYANERCTQELITRLDVTETYWRARRIYPLAERRVDLPDTFVNGQQSQPLEILRDIVLRPDPLYLLL